MVDVSVILPIYNIKDTYLKKCIDSLLIQTKKEIEIILVDDGSTNNALTVCKEYEKQDSRIRVVHQSNQGVSIARNVGLEHSRGRWICFVDPDDWVSEEYVERLYRAASDSGADLVQCDCHVCYSSSGKSVYNKFLDRSSGLLVQGGKDQLIHQIISRSLADYYPPEIACGTPWAKMYRKSLLDEKEIRYIPGMVRMQDTIFSLYGIQESKKVYYLSEPLYFYRKEAGSASFRYNPNIVEYFEKFFREVDTFLERYHRDQCEFDAFRMKKLTSINSYILYYFYNKNNPMTAKKKKNALKNLMKQEPYRSCLNQIYNHYLGRSETVFVYLLKSHQYLILSKLCRLRSKFRL